MISFIVIGRNEGWKLSLCIESILTATAVNGIREYEILYVDSYSEDDSILRARSFNVVKTFRITGKYNAAIARNIGAKESSGDLLCFLDGDLELKEEFMKNLSDFDFEHGILSGQSVNFYYDYNGKFVRKVNEHLRISKTTYTAPLTCGYFFIRKKLWFEVNGMKHYFRTGEDPDLGLRLAARGYLMHRFSDIMVFHHTFSRRERNKIWQDLWQKRKLYGTSLLIRENFFNKYTFRHLYRSEKTLIVLILSFFFCFITPHVLWSYILFTGIRTFRHTRNLLDNGNLFLNYIARDVTNLLGFFFFWPSKKAVTESYIRIS